MATRNFVWHLLQRRVKLRILSVGALLAALAALPALPALASELMLAGRLSGGDEAGDACSDEGGVWYSWAE